MAYGAELVEVPLSAADAQGSMQVARMQKAQSLADRTPNSWYVCQHKIRLILKLIGSLLRGKLKRHLVGCRRVRPMRSLWDSALRVKSAGLHHSFDRAIQTLESSALMWPGVLSVGHRVMRIK